MKCVLWSTILLCSNWNSIYSMDQLQFPDYFKFGVATAAYQIEGGWNASGKGENIWDRYTHEHPEKIQDHSTGDVACDSYHLWKRDIEILEELGVDFYRFSLSWTRILPTGTPNVRNQDGIDYYNNLIDLLIQNNIQPMVTLYHWDLPQPLQELGGWPNPQLALYFEDYARVCFELFGDRVKTWITINEPKSFCEDTYATGRDAPGILSPGVGDYLCGKTVLLAHARAYRLYDKEFRDQQQGIVSITIDTEWFEPKTNTTEDKDAAERVLQMQFGWFAHPVYSKEGDYPQIMNTRVANMSTLENYPRSRLPVFTSDEIDLIRGTADFFALNHYSTSLAINHEYPLSDPTSFTKDTGVKLEQDPNWPASKAKWLKVVPWGFRKLLNWIKNEYGSPQIIITENGFADDGALQDAGRVHYYKGYLQALLEAIHVDGVNVTGYTAWSVIDNMEWSDGYTLKFGLYHVNFDTPQRMRTKKYSASFYQEVISDRVLPKNSDSIEVHLN